MAEEEAIKTDNDSWRFEGETTIGLQPARAVSATRPAAQMGMPKKLFQEAKQPPELAEIQGTTDKEM
jgi:hypothetical protein